MTDPMIDPPIRPVGDDDYYGANAKLSYYKELLTGKLRSKNPKKFDEFISKVAEVRRKNPKLANDIVEQLDFTESLTPQEIKAALKGDYNDYIGTLRTIKSSGFADDNVKRLFGDNENTDDVSALMYGKRFATMPVVTSFVKKVGSDVNEDIYEYDPKAKKVNKYRVKRS